MKLRLATAFSILILAASPPVNAQRPPRKQVEDPRYEEARAAVKRGLAAAARGENEDAVAEYRRAEALVPDADIPYRLEAEALVSLGRHDEAIVAYQKYLLVKPDVSDRDRVHARIEELSARRSAVATVSSDPLGADVFLDGATEPHCKTPCEVEVMPGDHRFVLRAEGRAEAVLEVKASPAEHVHVFAPLAAIAPKPAVTPPRPRENESRGGSARRTVGLVTSGIGLVAIGAAGAMDLFWVSSRIDAFESARGRGAADTAGAFDSASTAQSVTLGTMIAGGVVLLAGAAIFLWPSRSTRHSSAATLHQ